MNGIAMFHAYKFTHYGPPQSDKTSDPQKLSVFQKLHLAIFGVRNPRPENNSVPQHPYSTIMLKSNKTIACWLIPRDHSRGTVILFHGYSGEKSSLLDKAEIFYSLGYSTMLVDFMGSGNSEGDQTTIGFKEAEQVRSCFDYLNKAGEKKIVLFGTSMGAAAVMKAMHDFRLQVNSIILECPFGTMLSAVKNRFSTMGIPSFPMAHLLVFWGGVENGFNAFAHNPVNYAKAIRCPTLFFYGLMDKKVSSRETEMIFKNLGGKKILVKFPLAGHEDYLLKYKIQWTSQVASFLD